MEYIEYEEKLAKYMKMYDVLKPYKTKEEKTKNNLEDYSKTFDSLSSSSWKELGKTELDSNSIPYLKGAITYLDVIYTDNLLRANEILYSEIYPRLVKLSEMQNTHDSYDNKISKMDDILDTKAINVKKNALRSIMDKNINEIEKYIKEINSLGTSITDAKTWIANGSVRNTKNTTKAAGKATGSAVTSAVTTTAGKNTSTYNALDGSWVIPNTNGNLRDYLNYIQGNGVFQASNQAVYYDSCLAFAETYGADLMNNTKTGADAAHHYAGANYFKDAFYDSKEACLTEVFNQINSGNPVVIQVNGNSQGTCRHFVTVVGYKAGITSASQLTEKDLLIVDSWDGQLERMDTSSSRFLTTGAACHKNYSGYYLRVKR